ncbi:hypothetical protein [Candidatus Nitrotoga arctica]|nr:hypothetical protein [Candidatus Nitrotoga arctica]
MTAGTDDLPVMTRIPTVASSAIADIRSADQTCVDQDLPVDFPPGD